MSKKQSYPLNKIRRNYTYTVQEIADLYGIAKHTVLRWIKDEGLKRILGSKKYFVHGSQLYRFLEKKRSKGKKPCKANEIFCFKCRCPQNPKPKSLEIEKVPNGTIRVLGKCVVCNTRMNKVVGSKSWTENHPFYPYKITPMKTHSGEQESQRVCQHKLGEQHCLNLTP